MNEYIFEHIVDQIELRRNTRHIVFVCGNGGSSSTAEHFTNDLFSKGVKAMCLNSNTAIITMIANDFGYEYIFEKQLEVYAEPGDLLIVFSCSGKSENIVRAVQAGIKAITIYGSDDKSYEDNEDRHLAIAHEVSKRL